MIFSLLLGAFATSAFAVDCVNDASTPACNDFTSTSEFSVTNSATNTDVVFAYKVESNKAYSFQKDTPFSEMTALLANQGGNGCYQHSDATPTITNNQVGSAVCSATNNVPCTTSAAGTIDVELKVTLATLVNKLDNAGFYHLWFTRVVENPITNAGLQWIATQGCKLDVAVEFECTGSACVEVKTIVCASFAGIDASSRAVMNIECRIPATFPVDGNCDGTVTANEVFSDGTPTVAHWGTVAAAHTAGAGKIFYLRYGTKAGTVIPVGQNYQGSIVLSGCISSGGGGGVSGTTQTIHTANYNLTRATRAITGLSMPIQVSFYTDAQLTNHWDVPNPTATNNVANQFNTPEGAPFLAQQQVSLGALTVNIDAFLEIRAKVATSTHWFLAGSVQVTAITKVPAWTTAPGANACVHGQSSTTPAQISANAGVYYTSSQYPQTYMVCRELMGTTASGAKVTAGDTLTFDLKWKIASLTSTSGKAQLLQEDTVPDPAAQSVEVSLTIQLGGGETTITTGAGAGEGSADNTVTYIIIAVCVIAAALILAVVVVAFMCMKNRANEQLVAMSPQKCTVAAVYDISAPKKADAMDV